MAEGGLETTEEERLENVKKFFSPSEWDKMSLSERERNGNILDNYFVMKGLGSV